MFDFWHVRFAMDDVRCCIRLHLLPLSALAVVVVSVDSNAFHGPLLVQ